MTERIRATYEIAAPAERIAERARALALEQSVECPLEAIGDPRILREIVAVVDRIAPVADGRYRVDVLIAAETTGAEPAQTINMIFGNASLWDDVRFVDAVLPPALLAAFPGPRHGIAGIRARTGVTGRALTSAAMKPQGQSVADLARLCRTFALAGVDVIKDDHGIANQAYAPFAERVVACTAAVREANAATGSNALYAPNLTGTPRVLRERARIARECGVGVVLVAPLLVGLPAFFDLVDEFGDFVYLAHPSFGGAARIAPALLFGRLLRLFGADAPIFVNYGGRFGYAQEECSELAAGARALWGGIAPALPVPAGGMLVDRVEELLAFYGPDTMLLIGGNLLIERDAILERTRAFTSRVANYR